MSRWRQGVVGVVINEKNKVLFCQRIDNDGWQFPQGGLEKGETPEEALHRELREEIGVGEVEILKKSRGKTRYRWPEAGEKHDGQEHVWFLCRLKPKAKVNLDESDGSFRAVKWVSAAFTVGKIIDWKREAHEKGLRMLGLIS